MVLKTIVTQKAIQTLLPTNHTEILRQNTNNSDDSLENSITEDTSLPITGMVKAVRTTTIIPTTKTMETADSATVSAEINMNNLINIRVGEINSNSTVNQGSNYNNRNSQKKHFVPAFLLSFLSCPWRQK